MFEAATTGCLVSPALIWYDGQRRILKHTTPHIRSRVVHVTWMLALELAENTALLGETLDKVDWVIISESLP